MQGIVGKNHVVTAYRDNPNGTLDLKVEWVTMPKRPPQGRRERLRRLRQSLGTGHYYDAAVKRVDKDLARG